MYAIVEKGKIKFYSTIPKKYNNDIAFGMRSAEHHKEKGFYPVIRPTLTDKQKLGEVYFDDVNEVYTYRIIDKSPTEIEQKTEGNFQAERERIRQEVQTKLVEDHIIANHTLYPSYFKDWKAGSYKEKALVRYNNKIYRNTVEGNTNAPDKGGWTEIK